MIIDARQADSTKYGRQFTMSTAVAMALDQIDVGGHADVSAFIDAIGNNMPQARLAVMVGQQRGDRRFSVRQQPGQLARIYRLA